MRLFSIPPPTLLAGFLAVLIGYASSFSFPHPLPAQLSGKTISQRRACG